MTDDEKRQQKAMLLLEYQEAEEHLASLQEKAKRYSESIGDVGRWFEKSHHYDARSEFKPEMPMAYNHSRISIISDPRYREHLNFDAIVALALEIKSAIDKVNELSRRKTSLGLK